MSNVNTCKCYQLFMMLSYVNNKSKSFHSIDTNILCDRLWNNQVFVMSRIDTTNQDSPLNNEDITIY
jgi:hypothetical protein